MIFLLFIIRCFMTTKNYKKATIKLIIGIVLLSASWWYLSHHPAERASLLSWVEVLSYRLQLWFWSIRGEDVAALEQQYKLRRYMQEVYYTAQHTSGCEESDLLASINATIDEVNRLPALQVSVQSATYRNKMREWEMKIQNHCTSSSNTK